MFRAQAEPLLSLRKKCFLGLRHPSSGSFVSSIAMSFNSLDSKTSPHSWHSTYSDSSSRETICTCGCLQCSGLTFFREECEGWPGVINLSTVQLSRGKYVFTKFAIFCGGELRMSSTQRADVIVSSMPVITVRAVRAAGIGTKCAGAVKYDDERE